MEMDMRILQLELPLKISSQTVLLAAFTSLMVIKTRSRALSHKYVSCWELPPIHVERGKVYAVVARGWEERLPHSIGADG